jgi:aldehyde dehydrogenase (NAD+)
MPEIIDQPKTAVREIFALQRERRLEMRLEPVENRKLRLRAIRTWIHLNKALIQEAAYLDFRKPPVEVNAIEILHVLNEISFALDNLDQWTKPKKVDAPMTMLGTRSSIHYEPKGICLIIAPWNYPFCLAIGPLISAIAAGNTAIVKPSEITPHMSAVIQKMIGELFEPHKVAVCTGGPEVSAQLLELPFDHIFFTGSPAIGKVVMKAAAANLASITLELGGKSPVIVTAATNLKMAAQRIAFAKFINNGQTCIAPDYVLANEKILPEFIENLKEQIQRLFFEGKTLEQSSSYARIVNEKHYARIQALVKDAVEEGAEVAWSGPMDEAKRFIHPVLLTHVSDSARILEEEIFGPVLPILGYKDLDEALEFINIRPKPLALYIFSGQTHDEGKILKSTSAGAVCINDCALHFLHHNLPFGGVNNSGIGKSHGYYGFLAFSNEKPVLRQRKGMSPVQFFYPPYTRITHKLVDWFLKLF